MKKIFIIVLLFASCKKIESHRQSVFVSITVLEPVSDLPVANAMIILSDRWNTPSHIGWTNENGVCDNVPSEIFNSSLYEFNIVKDRYWPSGSKILKATLSPEGWLRLYIPAYTGSYLNITIGPKRLPYGWGESTTYHDVQDTVLLIKAFGGEQNRINWQLISDSSYLISYDSLDVEIPRFDTTANVTLNL